ncbi:MAG: DUF1003 domain-containing protein [Dehalococcoidia bacterium]|nr:MAG: DUF1003 domain-containing protein [Dehalococcoidia bacterium]
MLRLLSSERAYIRAWQERAAHIEKQLLDKVRRRERVSKNVAVIHEQRLTFGERVSDKLAEVAGSWNFIFAFGLTLGIWILVNTIAYLHHWDKYPYILLNLMLSMLAAIQAPVIMMSQHRQEDRDRLRAEHDYEVNLKAEIEIQQLHQKLDELRDRQWNDLLTLQKQQIDLLQAQLALLRGQAENSRDG